MKNSIKSLSAQEAKFLSHLAAEENTIFTTTQAQKYWGESAYTANILSRLVRKGWLQRLERGVYMLLPLAAGPERAWSESGLIIAPHLIQPAAVAYWSAMHYWQMTEQIPRTVFVQSTRRKRALDVAGIHFRFVTVREARFFGVVRRMVGGKPIYVTDREKTLLDAAARPDLSGGILQLAQSLQAAQRDVNWDQLNDHLARWGGGVVVKRLGYLVETMAIPFPEREARLDHWQGMLSQGISPLEPDAGETGATVTRWRIRVNVDLGETRKEQI